MTHLNSLHPDLNSHHSDGQQQQSSNKKSFKSFPGTSL